MINTCIYRPDIILFTGVWENLWGKVWNNLKCLKRCAFQCIQTALKVWKLGFVKSEKVWNKIKIWPLTSLCMTEYLTHWRRFDFATTHISHRLHPWLIHGTSLQRVKTMWLVFSDLVHISGGICPVYCALCGCLKAVLATRITDRWEMGQWRVTATMCSSTWSTYTWDEEKKFKTWMVFNSSFLLISIQYKTNFKPS